MKISELESKLKEYREEHGDVQVLIYGSDIGNYGICFTAHRVAEEGEYPEDWDMPAGFEFIEIVIEQ